MIIVFQLEALCPSDAMSSEAHGRRPRTVAPSGQSAGQALEALECWLRARGTRDVCGLLSPLMATASWKSKPNAGILAKIADLLESAANLKSLHM